MREHLGGGVPSWSHIPFARFTLPIMRPLRLEPAMKRFAFQTKTETKLVRKPVKEESTEPTMTAIIGESSARLVNELAKDFVKYASGAILGGIVLYKAADTLSQVIVKKTKSADNDQ